jgi:glyoxylase-like metal-dependent hydrolase (beta-lactamase superfamily II)/rhodanese-related sulfurtransferase
VLIFRQMFDPASSTYTYLLADGGDAVLIDPVFEQARRDSALIAELGLRLVATLDTHVHADHVTGAWLMKQRFDSLIAISKASDAGGADRYLVEGDRISFGMRSLGVRATPGHTKGCVTYVLDGEEMAFTGDCLLIRGCGRTDFQDGDPGLLFRSVREKIFSLPNECPLYPAHDYRGLTATSVAEERQFNPRLGDGLSEIDFSLTMRNLRLAHPKQIDVAVPANMQCGFLQGVSPMTDPDWAPLTVTFSGIPEIDPQWVAENPSGVQILDVREPEEFTGPLGHIAGALLIPLGSLPERVEELSKDVPVVAVCRSGARSAQAVNLLRQAGFARVANLPGGMLRWRAEGLG